MNILEHIKEHRIPQLKAEMREFSRPSLQQTLFKDGLGLIAEFKKASPSAGLIEPNFDIEKLAKFYIQNDAVAFSVLTEEKYFQGSNEYLKKLSQDYEEIPILRKDFVFAPFQLLHAKFLGASAVLLIVNLLKPDELLYLHKLCLELELEVLVETHDENELSIALEIPNLQILGINNRNLENFEVRLENSFELIKKVPKERDFALVSESGFKSKEQTMLAKDAGFDGVLVGQSMVEGGLED